MTFARWRSDAKSRESGDAATNSLVAAFGATLFTIVGAAAEVGGLSKSVAAITKSEPAGAEEEEKVASSGLQESTEDRMQGKSEPAGTGGEPASSRQRPAPLESARAAVGNEGSSLCSQRSAPEDKSEPAGAAVANEEEGGSSSSSPESCVDNMLTSQHLSRRAEVVLLQERLKAASAALGAAGLGNPSLWPQLEEGEELERWRRDVERHVRSALRQLLQELKMFEGRLRRLHVDLDCLDDGGADALFSSPGKLKAELVQLQHVTGICAEFQSRLKGWLRCSTQATGTSRGLEALTDFLGEALQVRDQMLTCCGEFAARRRAAVARAKAAIEAADAEERASVSGLLQDALSPQSRIDFPRVTDICQRVADKPDEAGVSADVLFAALQNEQAPEEAPADALERPRRKLKALTIAHELLYDEHVLAEFATRPLEPLRSLEAMPQGSGLGAPAEESIRMLASEVRRRVEDAQQRGMRRSKRRAATFSFGYRESTQPQLKPSTTIPLECPGATEEETVPWHGDGEGPLRGRAGVEALIRRLRRWGSWHRWNSCEEQNVLEETGQTFRMLVGSLARLQEELDCLDDGSTGLPLQSALAALAPLVLAASDVQARAAAWSQALAGAGCVAKRPEQSPAVELPSLDTEKLMEFLEEALAGGDELHRRLQHFAMLRHDAVERAKARIEAGPLLQQEASSEPLVDWC